MASGPRIGHSCGPFEPMVPGNTWTRQHVFFRTLGKKCIHTDADPSRQKQSSSRTRDSRTGTRAERACRAPPQSRASQLLRLQTSEENLASREIDTLRGSLRRCRGWNTCGGGFWTELGGASTAHAEHAAHAARRVQGLRWLRVGRVEE